MAIRTTPAIVGALLAAVAVLPAPASAAGTAFCEPNDKPEPALQGQTPLADMASGRSQDPYFCGLRIVGHTDIYNRGANWQLARSQNCAYVSTLAAVPNDPKDPVTTRDPAGVAVIDASDPTAPKPVGLLRHPGALDAIETMDAVDAGDRHVLVAGDYAGGTSAGGNRDGRPAAMDIYDVTDCAKPTHLITYYWPDNVHDLTLSPDGKRVYGAQYDRGVRVLDITDMANPKLQADMTLNLPDEGTTGCHTVEFNASETRMICAGNVSADVPSDGETGPYGASAGPTIWDVSRVARGAAVEAPPLVGQTDIRGQGNHHAVPAMIGGRPYVVAANELSAAGCENAAFPRIWDVSDERNPKRVGEFRLEVQDHCDDPSVHTEDALGNYASHYNSVDDPWNDTRMGLFGMTGAGFRVVDLRNPAQPREIAYYKPGANPITALQPGVHGFSNIYFEPAVTDACGARNAFVRETGQIWFVCQSNGFFIAELSPEARSHMSLTGSAAQPVTTGARLPATGTLKVISAAIDKGKRSSVRRRGLRARVRCSIQCKVTATASISRRVARALGLGTGAIRIGKGRAAITTPGRIPFFIQMTPRVKQALAKKRVKKFKLAVVIVVTDNNGKQAKRVNRTSTLT